MMVPAVFPAVLLLLLLPGTLTEVTQIPINVVVKNSIDNSAPLPYSTDVIQGGILLGALNRLMETDSKFNFTYTEDPNYGPYLQSVNGVAGNNEVHTYWELWAKKADGKDTRLDVGIGCYVPSEYETIILNFTKWEEQLMP